MPRPWTNNSRIRLLAMMLATMLVIFSLTRLVLLIYCYHQVELCAVSVADVLRIFTIGFVNDLQVVAYAAIPLGTYLLLIPKRFYQTGLHRYIQMSAYVIFTAGLLTIAVAEFLFWDEFAARFNFVSVDYLIYRREVSGNISESYPVYVLLLTIFLISLVLGIVIHRKTHAFASNCNHSLPGRLGQFLAILAIVAITAWTGQPGPGSINNRYVRELGLNGVYQFFHAFKANQLDYRENYLVEEDHQVARHLHELVSDDSSSSLDEYSISHHVLSQEPPSRKNVFVVVIESLSAKYIGYYGNDLGLTPHLDQIAKSSLHFDSFYATGTRTVRGLEAISLSIPPTPGRSIVKRPHNGGLFSIARVFNQQGYESKFIYGGYGYFDNMNEFFSGNGFDVVDRADFTEDEVTFSNIWGVADEDLYRKAIHEADVSREKDMPFFSLLMTTSNHRPYTYPEGRIDIPSGDGRYGAVKYTDYAIGQFIKEAKLHPWFDDTVFVFVADHTAGSAGKVDLDVKKYRIPFMIYSARDIEPNSVMTLSSQIDVAPTLMSVLHFDYDSYFFGRDILAMAPSEERALIANYQKLGLLTPTSLAILSPRKEADWVEDPFGEYLVEHLDGPDRRLDDVVAWYQGADYIYNHGLSRIE